MTDFIQFVYQAGSPALILGVIVFGMYKFAVFFFNKYYESTKADIQKDVEKYKNELDEAKQAFIYSLNLKQQESKSELDRILHEHQVKFTTLYNERNRVLNMLFGSLVVYFNKYEELTKCIRELILDSEPSGNFWEIESELNDLHAEAMYIYDPNKLYLNKKLSLKIKYYLDGVKESANQHLFYLQIFSTKEKRTIRNISNDYDFHTVVMNNHKMRFEELDEIELEFRKLLGVD